MTGLPAELQHEVDQLRTLFGELDVDTGSSGLLLLGLRLRGVALRVVVDLGTYPDSPPMMHVESGWEHPWIADGGRITGLPGLQEWNRTYGLAHLVRELNHQLIASPPRVRSW